MPMPQVSIPQIAPRGPSRCVNMSLERVRKVKHGFILFHRQTEDDSDEYVQFVLNHSHQFGTTPRLSIPDPDTRFKLHLFPRVPCI